MARVFRCDFCGLFRPMNRADIAYAFDYRTAHNCDNHADCGDDCRDVVDVVFTVSITCSPSCAESVADSVRVGGR
jgi:hypothetical protein